MATVGVLAVQGAFEAHEHVLERLGHRSRLLRAARDFEDLDGLVLPGGESTVQLHLIERLGLASPLAAAVARLPVLATCAGLILLAKTVDGVARAERFRCLDLEVARNAWGRQVDSFEALSDAGRPLVFIRAPRITRVGAGAVVLDRLAGEPVLVREGQVTCATFHPELTASVEVHEAVFGGPEFVAASSKIANLESWRGSNEKARRGPSPCRSRQRPDVG